MNRKVVFLTAGTALLLIAIALVTCGIVMDFPGPASAIACLTVGVVAFIIALALISFGLRGVKNRKSTPRTQQIGTAILTAGLFLTAYGAFAFFVNNNLPPNTEISRLPSLYLLFAGMAALFVGSVIRNFRLRT